MLRMLVSTVACLTMFSCGARESQRTELQGSYKPPLLIAMGGNTSCNETILAGRANGPKNMDMYSSYEALSEYIEAKLGIKHNFVLSCYGNTDTIQFLHTKGGETLKSANLADFKDVVAKELADSGSTFLVGHSYGGWLAMKVVEGLGRDFQFGGLFTLDPISRVDCSYNQPFGCQQAPRDINASARKLIHDKSETWNNYYQDNTFYLHSSKIAEAHDNQKVNTDHYDIDTNEKAWSDLQAAVDSRY